MGLLRLLLAGVVGAAVWLLVPRAGIEAASQELIALLALLMGGLLPAMTLTATILRGDGFSAKRVEEYGIALGAQMQFWGVLFLCAGVATAGIVSAKVLFAEGAEFVLQWKSFRITNVGLGTVALATSGFGFGAVVQRVYPAYKGLRSLLALNISMAKAQALANGRSRADALEQKSLNVTTPEAYAAFRSEAARREAS